MISRLFLILLVLLVLVQVGCVTGGIVVIRPGDDWKSALTDAQIAEIRQYFPKFEPELFAPGTRPTNRLGLLPGNFRPALFFGTARPRGFRLTPSGIPIETNGFDLSDTQENISDPAVYYLTTSDKIGEKFDFDAGKYFMSPQNYLETAFLKIPPTPNTPTILIDRHKTRIDLAEVDDILRTVRDAVVSAKFNHPLPVPTDPNTCEVVIEPTIFYATNTNFGNIWAGGLTEYIGNGRARIHVLKFYISSNRVIEDWRGFLVHEGMNCYLNAVGRRDLAF